VDHFTWAEGDLMVRKRTAVYNVRHAIDLPYPRLFSKISV
jgi:hypothetical protein